MFFWQQLEKTVYLEPRYFDAQLNQTLLQKLHKEVEGTCTGRYGFVITVTGLESVSEGVVQDGTGMVGFKIVYKAVVFRPFKNEVLDAVVTQVNKHGFMAAAGPLQIFVSHHQIPLDMKFDLHSDSPAFISEDETHKIQRDDDVRLKLIGVRVDAAEIFAIGSIAFDYLGMVGAGHN
jgi:DNA-directed RNA polymerase II subunit RPB7